MFIFCFFISIIIWEGNPDNLNLRKLYNYEISISKKQKTIVLQGYPQEDRMGIKYIKSSPEWNLIKIPLNTTKPFYSSNFPFSLTPGVKPSMFTFFENKNPGKFEVENRTY